MFRSMRSIELLTGVQTVIWALIEAIPALVNVLAFLLFLLMLFTTVGLQLFMGLLENRCRVTEFPTDDGVWPAIPDYDHLCGELKCPAK